MYSSPLNPTVKSAWSATDDAVADIDVIELNEAFAAQSLAVLKEMDKQGMHIDQPSSPPTARSRWATRSALRALPLVGLLPKPTAPTSAMA